MIDKLKVEIADTPATLAHGLMYRQELQEDEGMLFVFGSPLELRFWGKNTYIPLDIAFISDNVVSEIQKITPMSTRMITSSNLCNMAIEVNSGFFEKNNINVGDTAIIELDGEKKANIIFCR